MSKKLSNSQKGILYGVLAAFSFATYVLINRYVYVTYKVDIFNYTATFLVAGGFFAFLALIVNWIKNKLKIPLERSAWPVALNGVIAGVGLGTFVFGQGYTTAVNASILATSTAITTAIFSKYMLKDSLTRRQLIWFVVMFIGLYIAIVGFNGIHLNKGDLIVISACFALGFTNTFSKILMKNHSSQFVADGRLVTGGLFFVLVGLLLSGGSFLITYAGWWPLLAGFFFWVTIRFFYASVLYINPTKAIVLANSHPIITPIAGVLLLSEPYTWTKFLGSLILLVSIYQINKK